MSSLPEGLLRTLERDKMLTFGALDAFNGLLNSALEYAKCDLINLPRVYRKYNAGFGLQKNSELTPLFNFHIGKLRERGQVHFFKKYVT